MSFAVVVVVVVVNEIEMNKIALVMYITKLLIHVLLRICFNQNKLARSQIRKLITH